MIRVAAAQFAAGLDIEKNLQTCLRMINEAAVHRPDLLVLPEFCNRASWYENQDEVFDTAVAVDGPFLKAIAAKARQHRMHIVINCSTQRDGGVASVTSFMFDEQGNCIAEADKQTLMGHENKRFVRATNYAPIVETPFGNIGMYACRDGVTMETPRSLAIRGAQILCNSLNSFAFDEAGLHVPIRAPENRVFVVAANKVGPLIPMPELRKVAGMLGVPAHFLYGSGESQIIAPDGKVLARAPRSGEAIIWADIDPLEASDKQRPDGTDMLTGRRGELYKPISEEPSGRDDHAAADMIFASVYEPVSNGADAVTEVTALVEASFNLSLLTLPELFCFEDGLIDDPKAAAATSVDVLAKLVAACQGTDLSIVTSLVEEDKGNFYHSAYLVNENGVAHKQRQLHQTKRHAWATLGDEIATVDTSWGRVGLIVGDDSIYTEVAKVLAIKGADVVAIPLEVQEAWETSIGLIGRAAENRICIVAATRSSNLGSSVIITQHEEFQIFTNWKKRSFDGTINAPIVTRAPAGPGLTIAEIHPSTARFKTMSSDTNLIEGRAWQLADLLTN